MKMYSILMLLIITSAHTSLLVSEPIDAYAPIFLTVEDQAFYNGFIAQKCSLIEQGGDLFFEYTKQWQKKNLSVSKSPIIALMMIAQKGNLDALNNTLTALKNRLDEKNESIASYINTRDAGSTILHEAVKKGFYSGVQSLLAYGASINTRDQYGQTPVHIAVSMNNHNIFELCISQQIFDFNAVSNDNETILHSACQGSATLELVTKIVQKAEDQDDEFFFTWLNKATQKKARTAVDFAALKGKKSITEYLESRGAQHNLAFVNQAPLGN